MANSTEAAVCPFCNAVLPALAAAPSAEKLPCPRCGEPVPARRWQVAAGAISAGMPPAAESLPPVPQAANRKTAMIVVGIMVTMALIGMSYALWTTELRRSRDPKPVLDPITYRRPLELQGIGFLPPGSDVLVGLQIAEWLNDDKVGKPLLAEPRPAGLDWITKQATRITGMELKEIDHVLLATTFDANFPQVNLVIRTRRALAPEKIAEAKVRLHEDRPLYEFTFQPAGEALVWWVDDKTAVGVVRFDAPKMAHLSAFTTTPRPIDEALPAPMRGLLKERLAKHQFAWAVGSLDKLLVMVKLFPILPIPKNQLALVQDVKMFALGLEPIEGLTLNGHFLARDAKAAGRLEKQLAGVKIDGGKSQVAGPPPEAKEPWVTWQLRGDAAALRGWLTTKNKNKK